jgi:hypothetical protein
MLGIGRIQHRRVCSGRTSPERLHGRTANTAPEAQRDQLPLVEVPVEGGGRQEAVDVLVYTQRDGMWSFIEGKERGRV